MRVSAHMHARMCESLVTRCLCVYTVYSCREDFILLASLDQTGVRFPQRNLAKQYLFVVRI